MSRQTRYRFFHLFLLNVFFSCSETGSKNQVEIEPVRHETRTDTIPPAAQTDTALYDTKMMQLSNGDTSGRWPPKTPYPKTGAILPFKRIVAYYGNFYSTQMGILGEYQPQEVTRRLLAEIKNWEKADTFTPVLPAVHYIAVTAQRNPGTDGKYRARMPFSQIDKAIAMAKEMGAIVFLDIQVGLSTLRDEIPKLVDYLKMPQVHLGIDPEYSMKTGARPGTAIGIFDAADINYASGYLAALVNKYNLPPKILVVHRFTSGMVTQYKNIITREEVQLVMNMDGFGSAAKKKDTYHQCIYKEPVQFAGFKLFYKNDSSPGSPVMTAAEVLNLKPQPVYIQYQ
jgi:hypothetical protein